MLDHELAIGETFRQRGLWWCAFGVLGVLGIAGVSTISQNNTLPADALILVVLGLVILSARFCLSVGRLAVVVALLLFGVIHMLLGIARGVHMTDVAQAHKWVFFLAFLFLIGRTPGVARPMGLALRVLLALLLVKSALLLVINPGSRLGVLAESNFEITMYCMLMVVLWTELGRWRFIWLSILAVCTVLSLSRSGAIAFALLVLFLVLSRPAARRWLATLKPLVIIIAIIVPVVVFLDRGSNIEDSDRANFTRLFLEATHGRGPGEWLFGAPSLTPLPQNVCYSLSYYAQLFSSDGAGHCYSVVLHIFVLRALFDFGVVGLLAGVIIPLVALRFAGVNLATALALTAMALANGLSVSGVNSEFIILPLALAVMTSSVQVRERRRRREIAAA